VAFLYKINEELHGKSGSNQLVTAREFEHLCGVHLHTWPLGFYKGDFSPFTLSFLGKKFLVLVLTFPFPETTFSPRSDFSFPEKIYSHFHKQKCKPMHASAVGDVSSVTFFFRRRLKMLNSFVCDEEDCI
jgi:hypothetical protein